MLQTILFDTYVANVVNPALPDLASALAGPTGQPDRLVEKLAGLPDDTLELLLVSFEVGPSFAAWAELPDDA